MCPPPCGPRRSYRASTRVSLPPIKTRISKKAVEEVISSGDYDCQYRLAGSKQMQPYDGCTNNLYMILRDGETKVKVAGRRSPDYKEGFRTIIMDAPDFATLLLRTEE